MKFAITAKHLTVTDLDHQLIEKKLNRLQKLVRYPYRVAIVLHHDTHHGHGQVINCRVTITQGRHLLHAERSGASIQDALDEVIAALKRELQKNRDHKDKRRSPRDIAR